MRFADDNYCLLRQRELIRRNPSDCPFRGPATGPPNTGDKLRSGAYRREAAERTWRHCRPFARCRHELRLLHPLVRRLGAPWLYAGQYHAASSKDPRTSSIGGGHLRGSRRGAAPAASGKGCAAAAASRDASRAMIAAAVPAQPSATHLPNVNAAVTLARADTAIAEQPPHAKVA